MEYIFSNYFGRMSENGTLVVPHHHTIVLRRSKVNAAQLQLKYSLRSIISISSPALVDCAYVDMNYPCSDE